MKYVGITVLYQQLSENKEEAAKEYGGTPVIRELARFLARKALEMLNTTLSTCHLGDEVFEAITTVLAVDPMASDWIQTDRLRLQMDLPFEWSVRRGFIEESLLRQLQECLEQSMPVMAKPGSIEVLRGGLVKIRIPLLVHFTDVQMAWAIYPN